MRLTSPAGLRLRALAPSKGHPGLPFLAMPVSGFDCTENHQVRLTLRPSIFSSMDFIRVFNFEKELMRCWSSTRRRRIVSFQMGSGAYASCFTYPRSPQLRHRLRLPVISTYQYENNDVYEARGSKCRERTRRMMVTTTWRSKRRPEDRDRHTGFPRGVLDADDPAHAQRRRLTLTRTSSW